MHLLPITCGMTEGRLSRIEEADPRMYELLDRHRGPPGHAGYNIIASSEYAVLIVVGHAAEMLNPERRQSARALKPLAEGLN